METRWIPRWWQNNQRLALKTLCACELALTECVNRETTHFCWLTVSGVVSLFSPLARRSQMDGHIIFSLEEQQMKGEWKPAAQLGPAGTREHTKTVAYHFKRSSRGTAPRLAQVTSPNPVNESFVLQRRVNVDDLFPWSAYPLMWAKHTLMSCRWCLSASS